MKEKERRQKAGKRLRTCMEQRKLTRSKFVDLIADRAGVIYSEQFISQLRTGYRRITEQNAFIFAELLGIDAGYLLGKDDYSADSYEEYLSFMDDLEKQEADLKKWKEQLQADKANAELHKYNNYLVPCGYNVEASFSPEGALLGYKISHKGTTATISIKEMEAFRKTADKFIRLKVDALLMEHE